MRSLRWRIAGSYALLLAIVIAALGTAITLRFEQILRSQEAARALATMQDIERNLLPAPGSFSFGNAQGEDALLTLENPDNLERWSSTTTFIEVDDPKGYTLAKSFNMGAIASFGNSGVTPKHPQSQRRIEAGGRPFYVLSTLLVSGKSAAIVQIGEPLDLLYRAFHQIVLSVVIILIVAAICVALLSFLIASQATTPINELAAAMRAIGSEGLSKRLHWKARRDEIGALAESFDDLLARLEEAFARERQFISDASHELRTPLTSINANAQMLARWGDRDETVRKESLQTIVNESTALAGMVAGMLTLAKADSGESIAREPLSLAAVAKEAVEATAQRAHEKGLGLTFDSASMPIVEGNPALLRQMIANLIDNAIKFTAQGGVCVRVREDGANALVEVQDTGPGIDVEDLPYVFDRFYRTDKSRTRAVPGTGLGLAIVRSIARVHGGSVQAQRVAEGGALMRVSLPKIH